MSGRFSVCGLVVCTSNTKQWYVKVEWNALGDWETRFDLEVTTRLE